MKIAYLIHLDVSKKSGLVKKIERHIRCWQREGHEIHLFVLSKNTSIWEGISDIPVTILKATRKTILMKACLLFRSIRQWHPDLIYHRFEVYYPGLKRLMMLFPTVLELNSDDLSEFKVTNPWYVYLYHLITRELVLKSAAGLVFLTKEVADRNRLGKPFEIIGDSIDLSQFHQIPAPDNGNSANAVVIASSAKPWHGLDKIIWLAKNFQKWRFDIIGLTASDLGGELAANVTAHGFLDQSCYEKIMSKADVAFAGLAMHRINMNETTPLKVREYLAYGIPTIIGFKDTDFPEPEPFLLELPNTEDNVTRNAVRIEQFVKNWQGKRVPHEQIAHLDAMVKEKKRTAFLKKVLRKGS